MISISHNLLKIGESYFLQLFYSPNPMGYMLYLKGCKGLQFRVWENWGKSSSANEKISKVVEKS